MTSLSKYLHEKVFDKGRVGRCFFLLHKSGPDRADKSTPEIMNRFLLTAFVSILAVGCGKAAVRTQAASPEKPAVIAAVEKEAPATVVETTEVMTQEKPRAVGDYVVYRFSGSFRKAPVTLTERVVARDDVSYTIDLILEDGKKKYELRVRTSDAPATRGELLSIQRVRKGKLVAIDAEEYEQIMAKTMVTADENEAELGSEDVKVDIGGDSIVAKRTSFRVKIGEQTATLRTTVSDQFNWGDIAGEIAAEDGSLIYRAEVLSTGHVVESKKGDGPEVARSDYDDYE